LNASYQSTGIQRLIHPRSWTGGITSRRLSRRIPSMIFVTTFRGSCTGSSHGTRLGATPANIPVSM
jgi:hypothetical protein